eukprot:5816066-Alexandrium_andersonii.AAC.1
MAFRGPKIGQRSGIAPARPNNNREACVCVLGRRTIYDKCVDFGCVSYFFLRVRGHRSVPVSSWAVPENANDA